MILNFAFLFLTQATVVSGAANETWPMNLEVYGRGMFVLQNSKGDSFYSTEGEFSVLPGTAITMKNGEYTLLGFASDGLGGLTSTLTPISVPVWATAISINDFGELKALAGTQSEPLATIPLALVDDDLQAGGLGFMKVAVGLYQVCNMVAGASIGLPGTGTRGEIYSLGNGFFCSLPK